MDIIFVSGHDERAADESSTVALAGRRWQEAVELMFSYARFARHFAREMQMPMTDLLELRDTEKRAG